MKALDVDRLMEKGPAWAAAHLSPGDLSLVRQYIDLDEQMKFRCQAPSSLVHLKHLEEEDEEGGQNNSTAGHEAPNGQTGDGTEQAPAPGADHPATAPSGERKPPKAADGNH